MPEAKPWPVADWIEATLMLGSAICFILLQLCPAEDVPRTGFSAVVGLLMALCVHFTLGEGK
jgi:hypothetical protein